jgi:hypothetical protein
LDQAGFSVSEQDYRELYLVAFRRRMPLRFPLILSALAAVWLGLDDYCRCGPLSVYDVLRAVATGLVFGIGLYLFLLWMNVSAASQISKSLKHMEIRSNVSWDEGGINVQSNYGTAAYPWQVARSWMETRSLVVVYLASMLPLILPKHALDTEQVDDIKARLHAAGIKETMRRLF